MPNIFSYYINIFLAFGEQQQKGTLCHQESDELQDTRNLRDEDLRNLAQVIVIYIYLLGWSFFYTWRFFF